MGFALSSCGTLRLAYSNAPGLAFWWLDGYLDFDAEQSPRLRADLQSAQDWHRKEELPLLLEQLGELQSRALQPTTPEAVCQMTSDLQNRYQAALAHMVPTIVAMAPTLREAQLAHLEKELAKRRADWQRDYVDGTAAQRMERRYKKTLERTESFYGRLTSEQIDLLRTQITTSGFDAAIQDRENLRRHHDMLEILGQIRSGVLAPSQVPAAVAALLQRLFSSPNANYRAYLARATQQGCVSFAALHNSTLTRQRVQLAETLQDYAQDLQSQLPATSR